MGRQVPSLTRDSWRAKNSGLKARLPLGGVSRASGFQEDGIKEDQGQREKFPWGREETVSFRGSTRSIRDEAHGGRAKFCPSGRKREKHPLDGRSKMI